MELGDCWDHNIYRGNRFITRKDILGNNTNDNITDEFLVDATYKRVADLTHTYQLSIEAVGLCWNIITDVTCGRFLGFRAKTKGAELSAVEHLGTWTETKTKIDSGVSKMATTSSPSPSSPTKTAFRGITQCDVLRWLFQVEVGIACFAMLMCLSVIVYRCYYEPRPKKYTKFVEVVRPAV